MVKILCPQCHSEDIFIADNQEFFCDRCFAVFTVEDELTLAEVHSEVLHTMLM